MIKRWHHPNSRPLRACIYILFSIVMLVVMYIALGCPTLSMRQEYRRAEKANLVGPGTIVDMLTEDYAGYNKILVGETEYGICFLGRYSSGRFTGLPYGWYSSRNYYGSWFDKKSYVFTYREKTEDLTIAAVPCQFTFWASHADYSETLPVYLFDEYPQAVKAEVEITINGTDSIISDGHQSEISFKATFEATAHRTKEGFFLFFITGTGSNELRALSRLSHIGSGYKLLSENEANAVIPATVRLYDAQGNLLLERDLEITA